MKIPLFYVDAFTDKIFSGNPAAVCPLDNWIDDELMQNIAFEHNLSETAFFVPKGDATFEIRWFTPKMEIDLAGHPTLATGYVIFNLLGYSISKIKLLSKTGELFVTKRDGLITLNFPSRPPSSIGTPETLVQGLGQKPLAVYKARDYLALYETEQDIIALRPDFRVLSKLDCLGIIVTAPSLNADFVSRFFAPAAGIDEDPVTGSSHTTLIPFWAERLSKKELHAFQLSQRKGELFCRFLGDRVEIGGKAVLYMRGEIEI
ncbi:MAG: phenazine biosynthesis protein PhzF family [Promethearchaeota archaeon CR_4]|nr:MAG: phenazine biosynthesis protein PhzF family [Candidatus Lokiarchaeota archaeon CR_4]